MKIITALLCGVLFGFGLALSGMTDTTKVIGFLDIFGQWVPDLIFVMVGAIAVSVIAFALIKKKTAPIMADKFELPSAKHLDKKLIGGGILFGIGWGLYGYCPGPAIAALAYMESSAVIFIIAMLAGMFSFHFAESNTAKN